MFDKPRQWRGTARPTLAERMEPWIEQYGPTEGARVYAVEGYALIAAKKKRRARRRRVVRIARAATVGTVAGLALHALLPWWSQVLGGVGLGLVAPASIPLSLSVGVAAPWAGVSAAAVGLPMVTAAVGVPAAGIAVEAATQVGLHRGIFHGSLLGLGLGLGVAVGYGLSLFDS